MADLSYSDDALNVRNAFFGVKTIIYVEGDDDILFWKGVFEEVTTEPFEIESVGGAVPLDEYIEKIKTGELQAIAARDADFLPNLGTTSKDPKVVYTYGYSIENSLYTPISLKHLTDLWCKSSRLPAIECVNWLSSLATTLAPLIHLDIANAISDTGLPTIGDNCSRYMTSKHSETICPTKIAAAVAALNEQIPAAAVATAATSTSINQDNILIYLRGHFLASAVQRFIVRKAKNFGKKVSISTESLYAAAVSYFSAAIKSTHPHRSHYIESARSAWESI